MKDDEIVKRLPLHLDYIPKAQLRRLTKSRQVLAVATRGEHGFNFYPGAGNVPIKAKSVSS